MRNNQHLYQHKSPSNQYYDSPQSSQREQDIASLIEKKLGSIESYFQNYEERIGKLESTVRESHNNSFAGKSDHGYQNGLKQFREEFLNLKSEYNKKFMTVDQHVSDLSRSIEKAPGLEKVEKAIKEQHLAIENLQEKIVKIQEKINREPNPQQKINSEVLEYVKQNIGLELRGLNSMIQNVQDSQAHLETELNSLKRTLQSGNIIGEKYAGKAQPQSYFAKSPNPKKFERESTETSEEERPSMSRYQASQYPQASPYSPDRKRSNLSSYEDLSLAPKADGYRESSHKKDLKDFKDLNPRSPNENSPYGAFTRKKYEASNTEAAVPPRKDLKSDSSSEMPSKFNQNRSKVYDDAFNKDGTFKAHGDFFKNTYAEQRNLTDPSRDALGFKKGDRKESSISTTWLDNEDRREQFELKDAAIQKNKEKIKEDIENLKKLVKREKEKRSTTADKTKGGDRLSESADEKPLIRLQSAMPLGQDPVYRGHLTPSHDHKPHREEFPRSSSSMTPHENNDYATFRYDDIGKERGESHLRVASILEEKSRTRSASVYDAKQQTGEFNQERKDNRLSGDKKKQIDLEIERRIKEETDKRKRETIARGSGLQYLDQPTAQKSQSIEEKGIREYADLRQTEDRGLYSFKN